MFSSNQIDGRHLRAIVAAELRAERDLEVTRAEALVEVCKKAGARGSNQLAQALATITPRVIRARTKLVEARLERIMAEHLVAGHLLDDEAGHER